MQKPVAPKNTTKPKPKAGSKTTMAPPPKPQTQGKKRNLDTITVQDEPNTEDDEQATKPPASKKRKALPAAPQNTAKPKADTQIVSKPISPKPRTRSTKRNLDTTNVEKEPTPEEDEQTTMLPASKKRKAQAAVPEDDEQTTTLTTSKKRKAQSAVPEDDEQPTMLTASKKRKAQAAVPEDDEQITTLTASKKRKAQSAVPEGKEQRTMLPSSKDGKLQSAISQNNTKPKADTQTTESLFTMPQTRSKKRKLDTMTVQEDESLQDNEKTTMHAPSKNQKPAAATKPQGSTKTQAATKTKAATKPQDEEDESEEDSEPQTKRLRSGRKAAGRPPTARSAPTAPTAPTALPAPAALPAPTQPSRGRPVQNHAGQKLCNTCQAWKNPGDFALKQHSKIPGARVGYCVRCQIKKQENNRAKAQAKKQRMAQQNGTALTDDNDEDTEDQVQDSKPTMTSAPGTTLKNIAEENEGESVVSADEHGPIIKKERVEEEDLYGISDDDRPAVTSGRGTTLETIAEESEEESVVTADAHGPIIKKERVEEEDLYGVSDDDRPAVTSAPGQSLEDIAEEGENEYDPPDDIFYSAEGDYMNDEELARSGLLHDGSGDAQEAFGAGQGEA